MFILPALEQAPRAGTQDTVRKEGRKEKREEGGEEGGKQRQKQSGNRNIETEIVKLPEKGKIVAQVEFQIRL